jgi:hypothetical protein
MRTMVSTVCRDLAASTLLPPAFARFAQLTSLFIASDLKGGPLAANFHEAEAATAVSMTLS